MEGTSQATLDTRLQHRLLGTLILGFMWAWLLEKGVRGESLFRAVYLFPMAVSFIASGVVWRWLLNNAEGDRASGLNRLFGMIGLDFLQNPWWTHPTWGIVAIAVPATLNQVSPQKRSRSRKK